MHQPAWSLFDTVKLAGVDPVRDGYVIDPHLPMKRFSLRLPRLGVEYDDVVARGYVVPERDGDMTMRVRPPDGDGRRARRGLRRRRAGARTRSRTGSCGSRCGRGRRSLRDVVGHLRAGRALREPAPLPDPRARPAGARAPALRAACASAAKFVRVRRRGRRLVATVDLRGRPKQVVRVRIVARTNRGRTLRSTRAYRTCTPGRRRRGRKLRSVPARRQRVIIVGAGLGGIAAAIELREHGFDDLVVLDAAPDMGGTWFHNTYPGCACDVPSHLYSYSYAQRRDWSRLCSPQDEILSYVHEVAREHGVDRLVRYDARVASCAWDDERRGWTVTTEAGEAFEGEAVVIATGQLHEPSFPRLEGVVRRARVPLRALGSLLRPARQARRGDRDRRERGAVRAGDRRGGRAPHGLPADGQLVPAAQEPPVPAAG